MDNNSHTIKLEDRKKLVLDGVKDVISFDDMTVALETFMGRLIINGNELHIQTLCLESGNVVVEGNIDELVYEDSGQNKKKGIFGRANR